MSDKTIERLYDAVNTLVDSELEVRALESETDDSPELTSAYVRSDEAIAELAAAYIDDTTSVSEIERNRVSSDLIGRAGRGVKPNAQIKLDKVTIDTDAIIKTYKGKPTA